MRKLTDKEIAEPDITLRFKDGQVPREIIKELEPYGIEWGVKVHKVTIPAYRWADIEGMMRCKPEAA